MNKTAQTFLGLAVAIIFPVFVLYAAVTFVPSTDNASTLVDFYRALIGLGFGMLGLLGVMAVLSIPSLVYGLASGAGLTLIGAITALLSTDEAYHGVVASTLTVLFMVLAAMAILYDRRFGSEHGPVLATSHGDVAMPPPPPVELVHPAAPDEPKAPDSHA